MARPVAILLKIYGARHAVATPSVFDPDPLPFIALMGLGFVIGVTGHIYKSRTAVATGIGMIFVATLLLPLGIYLGDR